MKSEWKSFLADAGAVFRDGEVAHFGNPARELQIATTGGLIADLSHTGLIAVRGEDAATFLQGQLTNDVRQVSEGLSQLCGYCTAKGRLLAIFRIFLRDQAYYLELPETLLEGVLTHLRRYVLRAKVTLEYAGESLLRIGFSSPQGEEALRGITDHVPDKVNSVIHTRDMTVVRVPGPHPRFELFGALEDIQRAWSALDVHAAPVGAPVWSLLDILAGVPAVYPETSEVFLPQMVNLEAVGGLSFKKGCYPGQEIVARTQYRGRIKRRMYLTNLASDTPPRPGDSLFIAGTSARQAGTIVSAQPSPDGGSDSLAVIVNEYARTHEIHLHDPTGPLLHIKPLPYEKALERRP